MQDSTPFDVKPTSQKRQSQSNTVPNAFVIFNYTNFLQNMKSSI
jgi:hypothetical protein